MTPSSPAPRRGRASGRNAIAFTLVELIVSIAIITVLISLLLPAIGMVRNSVKRSKTISLLDGLTAAAEIYVLEDGRHRYPPAEADQSMRTCNDVGDKRTLDLLRDRGSQWRHADLDADPSSAAPDRLIDSWQRPIHYVVDNTIDKVIARPATSKTNWNPKSQEPFAYIWSLGRPSGNETADLDPAVADRWLYHGSSN